MTRMLLRITRPAHHFHNSQQQVPSRVTARWPFSSGPAAAAAGVAAAGISAAAAVVFEATGSRAGCHAITDV